MKKVFIILAFAVLLAFFAAPSVSHAAAQDIGSVILDIEGNRFSSVLLCNSVPVRLRVGNDGRFFDYIEGYPISYIGLDGQAYSLYASDVVLGYIPSLYDPFSFTVNGVTMYIYNTESDYLDNLPDDFRPDQSAWDSFYDLYEFIFGYEPLPGSFFDTLRSLFEGDSSPDTIITFPTLTPTPTPSPTPTPIPVQTIFVPDGNGNTTIIYQYPDPTTGVITQSPYNPNVTNNITVNCDCDGSGGGTGPFISAPEDPYTYDASLFWADGFGVQMSDNPLSVASDSQLMLKSAAMEYDSSVQVLSNSFNILPSKWLVLIGLCGGILIIAGLIRTFLGG